MRRRAQIGRPDRRRNRYPLASAEGFFNTICAFPSSRRLCTDEVRRRPAEIDQPPSTAETNRKAAKFLVLKGFEHRRSNAKSSHLYLPCRASFLLLRNKTGRRRGGASFAPR